MLLAFPNIPLVPDGYQLHAQLVAALIALVAAWRLWQRIRRFRRSRRPATLHPNLARYGIDPEEAARARREAAARIVATSSGPSLVGYEITEQIDAVFVDGFRSPAEAIEGLKAEAAGRGANAVVNVRQERSAAGRCTASGDAVKARRIEASPPATAV